MGTDGYGETNCRFLLSVTPYNSVQKNAAPLVGLVGLVGLIGETKKRIFITRPPVHQMKKTFDYASFASHRSPMSQMSHLSSRK